MPLTANKLALYFTQRKNNINMLYNLACTQIKNINYRYWTGGDQNTFKLQPFQT